MTAIGILGGMGPQASARLHTLLIREAPRHMTIETDTDFPEIVHISVPVPNFIHDKTNLQKAKNILINRTQILETAGCTIIGIACNTAHLLLNDLQATTTVQFVSLPHLVADRIDTLGHKRVGLLATPNTLRSTMYDDAMGPNVSLIRPDAVTAEILEAMIFRTLKGVNTDEDSVDLREIVDRFIVEQELDAVILGCTELPLIFGDHKDERVIDTLEVLAEGLLKAV